MNYKEIAEFIKGKECKIEPVDLVSGIDKDYGHAYEWNLKIYCEDKVFVSGFNKYDSGCAMSEFNKLDNVKVID